MKREKSIIKDNNLVKLSQKDIKDGTYVLPIKVYSISKNAFDDCDNLNRVVVSRKKIGQQLFQEVKNLNVVEVKNCNRIEMMAFLNCDAKEIILPESLKTIEHSAFNACKNLKRIHLPESVETMYERAFVFCTSLKEVSLSSKLEAINRHTFAKCKNLEKVNGIENIKYIDHCAFENCENLKSLNFGVNLSYIDGYAFSGCKELESIKLGQNIKFLGDNAFQGCENLKNINLPDSLEEIGVGCFSFCKSLEKIVLPKNLKILSTHIFKNCKSLKCVEFNSKLEQINQDAFSSCHSLEYVKLPNSLKYIQRNAFEFCGNLKEVVIPNGLKQIGDDIFHACSKLENIVINGKKIKATERIKQDFNEVYDFLVYATANNKFIPKNIVVMANTNNTEIENFYKHTSTWKEVMKEYLQEWKPVLVASMTTEDDLEFYMADLYKISTALGLFQDGKNGELAKEFIKDKIYKMSPEVVHELYGALNTKQNGYNEEFAKFYIKNYRTKSADGIRFLNREEYDIVTDENHIVNYTANAYNNWNKVKQAFPNKTVLSHREHASENNNLTEEDVINSLESTNYENVDEGNEEMAKVVGKYGYSQYEFEKLQDWWNEGKVISDDQKMLKLKKDDAKEGIKFELLSKQDPESLILGEKTNCCQVVNDAGKGCLKYGVTETNSGFVKFTKNGKLVGQSWAWYNQKTGVVCLDNIEIPTIWRNDLEKSNNEKDFLNCLSRLATAFKQTMEQDGRKVSMVTVGAGCNDLSAIKKFQQLPKRYIELPEDYRDYSDAKSVQYIIPFIEKTKNTEPARE